MEESKFKIGDMVTLVTDPTKLGIVIGILFRLGGVLYNVSIGLDERWFTHLEIRANGKQGQSN